MSACENAESERAGLDADAEVGECAVAGKQGDRGGRDFQGF